MTLTTISIIIWAAFTAWILLNNVLLTRAVKTQQRIILMQESAIAGLAAQKQDKQPQTTPQTKTAGENENKSNRSNAAGGAKPRKTSTKRASTVGKATAKK